MTVHPSELAATLVARRRVDRALTERRAGEIRAKLSLAARSLRREAAVDGAWLIGSLAWGGFGERSDADVVVRGADSSRAGALAGRLGEVAGVAIDLLLLEELPEGFRCRVITEGIRLDEP